MSEADLDARPVDNERPLGGTPPGDSNEQRVGKESPSDRGLLDLSVELSMRDIMAGKQFALFVLVKNPFSKPVWINRVHVSLPSELMLKEYRSNVAAETQAEVQSYQSRLLRSVKKAEAALTKLSREAKSNKPSEPVFAELEAIKDQMASVIEEENRARRRVANVAVDGSKIQDLRVGSRDINVSIGGSEVQNLILVGAQDEQQPRMQVIELESSLPDNVALQQGSTAVYTVALNVRETAFFRPSRYRLQFNVNYAFYPGPIPDVADSRRAQFELFTNTVTYELPIRASVYAVMQGAGCGGLIGSVVRVLQISKPELSSMLTVPNAVTIVVASILSIMAIIFTARKSDAQSFVSVEDFWGGLLVGFFVGYSGTTFFEHMTGLKPPA
jgi:hypothetical protein